MFVSQQCLDDASARAALPSGRTYSPISGSRGLGCADMLHNTATPHVEVEPGPVPVRADGREIALHRSPTLPLTRLHHLA